MSSLPSLRRERMGALAWTLRQDQRPTWWRPVMVDPDVWLKDPAHHFKHSRNVTVTRIQAPAPGLSGLVLRRLNYGRWRSRLRDFFRRSRAQRAFHTALALEAAGLPVARALASADRRRWRWPRNSYLISVEIAEARTLREVVRMGAYPSPVLARTLGKLVARLHASGFVHGDLKATNILVGPTGEPWLIDFDGVRHFANVPRFRAAADLARLATGILEAGGKKSPWLGMRFVKSYCAARGIDDWRGWGREVFGLVRRAAE